MSFQQHLESKQVLTDVLGNIAFMVFRKSAVNRVSKFILGDISVIFIFEASSSYEYYETVIEFTLKKVSLKVSMRFDQMSGRLK